ncbi:MAG: glycoside hydrolase [Lachnospiraceae bacterium]|nr:glycoside hydrolase [Lachnospiraceae bacterium]
MLSIFAYAQADNHYRAQNVAPGVWKFTFGSPDSITPIRLHPDYLKTEMPGYYGDEDCPVTPVFEQSARGIVVSLPLKAGEGVYGLGLQFGTFNHRGTKKTLRVNADPKIDTGDSHAPVPFYATTEGYGVFVDSSRDITFYCGNKNRNGANCGNVDYNDDSNDAWNATMSNYQRTGMHIDTEMLIEIPFSKGVDIYVFGGPGMIDAVARYNMFSGGGAVPPRWGLGFWYRGNSNFTADRFLAIADSLSSSGIACDVFGLETHWQTHAYSSSLVWDENKFPDPQNFITDLSQRGIHLNMWLQAFTHPTSPSWNKLKEWSGDFTVWDGLVPDFLTKEGRRIYSEVLDEYVEWGLSGFKADECDNSDFTGNWSFPYISKFPSGADGEQMHNLIGVKFQQTLNDLFRRRDIRTYSLVRSSGALAASSPFVLYSDLYDHRTFVKGISQAGFSGLLWCPELRDAKSPEDLLLRMSTAVFSPLCMYNGWFLEDLPWAQFIEADSMIRDKFRSLIDLRMSLIPYLHAAFVNYHLNGQPPFRALILDYPEESENLLYVSNQYMMGDAIMVAPQTAANQTSASIYFPKGKWRDFFTGDAIESDGENIKVSIRPNECPIFVKDGTLLPLANSTLNTSDPASRLLNFRIFGSPQHAECALYDDPCGVNPTFTPQTFIYDSATNSLTSDAGFYKICQ